MSLLEFIQLILRNKKWVIYFPVIVGISVFYLTRNTPHVYSSEMVIYTGIASGFNPDNDYDSKIDFHAVTSRFDNLINIIGSREIRKEVALKLLAHMIHNPDKMATLLENSKSATLTKTLTKEFVAKYKKEDEEATEKYLQLQLDSSAKGGDVYQLIFSEKVNCFNVKTLADIKAVRQGFSDMLQISYECEDPFTCKKTLDLTKDAFLEKYKGMRIGEANTAVAYFKQQTSEARKRLAISEDNLKGFRAQNRVINYYEQTKYIADQNEHIEQDMSALQMELDGYITALQHVEEKIGKRWMIQLQSEKIVRTRDSLSAEFTKAGLTAVKEGTLVSASSAHIDGLKTALKESVDRLYALNNTIEGIPGKKLVDQWLTLVVSKEETESKLRILLENKTKFDKVFDKYAPMGSELSKLEREVETAEKEYLNLLHNLNQAILRERNLEVSETVEVIDEAELPIVPNPSKRMVLVIASILACIIIAIVLLIIKQYLDNSLASPMRMEKLIGISAATAFLSRAAKDIELSVFDEIDHRSFERWHIAMGDILNNPEHKSALIVLPFNCDTEQVKRYVDRMVEYMKARGIDIAFTSSKDFAGLQNEHCFVIADKPYPELLPRIVLEQSKLIFFFFDAAQKLDEYEMQLLENWKRTGITPKGILLNANEQNITKYLGEIPRKRSKFRTFIKKQVTRYAS